MSMLNRFGEDVKELSLHWWKKEEVGRGHFGHTCWAKGKKGDLKGQSVAVKIISKAKVRGFVMFFFVIEKFV